MIEITTHLIYDNDGEIFVGYTSPLFCNTLHQDNILDIPGAASVEITKALRRCKTFEDYPMSMKNLLDGNRLLHLGDGNGTLKLQNLFFRPLADVLNQKSPVKVINLMKDYNKFWHSDYIFFYNISNKYISINTDTLNTLFPESMMYYCKVDGKVYRVALPVIDVLLHKEVRGSAS